ncbi:hypothetical protein HAX54_042226 [Datura stramonium]|uniref:Protein kinase domain-containing protein n=1 Tax=Datura stramonium TaxID=4076 RepID=A0ABS8VYU0_DATST|nr:hypothetical protein [Datura stramonium]
MLALEFLDLSLNNLSGEIPKSLEDLVYLKYLNFSFNGGGEIPTGGPFSNATGQSFLSNDALCGDSRFNVKPCLTKSTKKSSRKGMVYKGILKDGTTFAAKGIQCAIGGAFQKFDTECEILCNLHHRNLTKVITSYSSDFKALVLECMPNGTLDQWLYSHNLFLNLLQRLDIMIDVAYAMDYLHNGYSTSVVHCDLKPSNVLLDQEMVGHVTDFGIAKLLGAGEAFV